MSSERKELSVAKDCLRPYRAPLNLHFLNMLTEKFKTFY